MSTKKAQLGIGRRLREAIGGRWRSIRAFSTLTGIPYRSLLQYLREERSPGAEVLARMAARSGMDLHYLLLGEGSPYRRTTDYDGVMTRDGAVLPYAVEARLPHTLQTLPPDKAVVDDVMDAVTFKGLEPVLFAARRGGLSARLRVLEALDRAYPDSLSFEELARRVAGGREVDSRDLAADLALLVHEGLVAVEGAQGRALNPAARYRTAGPHTRMQVEHFADRCQHLLEAVRILVRTVFPHIERRDGLGKLATVTVMVPRAEIPSVAERLVKQLERSVQTVPNGEDRVPISVVLAIGMSVEEEESGA